MSDVASVVQLGGFFVAAIAVLVTLRGIRDQLWLGTFTEYTKRYGAVMDDMPLGVRRRDSRLPARGPKRDELLLSARRYFNLCSEEYYLYVNKRIDKKTWSIWEDGIRSVMESGQLREAWGELEEEYQVFPVFHRYMSSLVAGGLRV